MTLLPLLSGMEIVKKLAELGYIVDHQRGSHMRLKCLGKKSVTVPNYRTVSRGLLRKILRDADLTPDEFIKL